MAGQPIDIFVSYKAEDRARVARLVAALEAEGFSLWWDTHIGGGTHWREDIQEHLDCAKCVIVVWSRRSVGREGNFVRDEATRAQRRGAYLPVRIDPVDPPLGFGEIQALSLVRWNGDPSDPRFRAVTDAARACIAGEDISHHFHFAERGVSRRTAIAGGSVAAVAIAGVGAWELLKPSAAAAAGSIAVLPFANLSGDPAQSYFSDGISDEIRSALTRLGGLTVIGSTSSEAVRNDDARTAAKKLGVAHILTGNVRKSPSTIRIAAELIDGRTGADRWTQDYDRSPGDTIKIQTDIAQNVASALQGALGLAVRAAITLGGTADPVAQDLLLQARKLARGSDSAETRRRTLALAEAAIARDPNYVDAYIDKAIDLQGLATNYAPTPAKAADGLAQAEADARKAVALAPRLGIAHAALAHIASFRLDFVTCLRETRMSLALAPDDPPALMAASEKLAFFGDGAKAIGLIDRAIELDPLNEVGYSTKAEVLTLLRRYPQAIEAGSKALAMVPDDSAARMAIGDARLLLGQSANAKAEYEGLHTDDPFRVLRLALLAARTGDRAGAEKMVEQVKQQFGAAASYQYAEIYAQLGDKDRAFAEIDNAVRARDPGLASVKVDPFFDPIRGDPRYAALLKRLNFPAQS